MISKHVRNNIKKLLSDLLSYIELLTTYFNEFPIQNPEFSEIFGPIRSNLIFFNQYVKMSNSLHVEIKKTTVTTVLKSLYQNFLIHSMTNMVM